MLGMLFVAVGGAIGSVLRYLVTRWAAEKISIIIPYGTFIVNVVGCFMIGFFMLLLTERMLVNSYWRLFITVGFIGGLTTFSSFSYESLQLLLRADYMQALCNIGGNILFLCCCNHC